MKSSPDNAKPRIYVDSQESLQEAFHELIPISKAMGVTVQEYTGTSLIIRAPLALNINHQHSAFGGSLFAVAALAGWGLMQMKLSEHLLDCNTVVQNGEVSYERPVYDDLVCKCTLPEDADSLFESLRESGKASTTLISIFETTEGKVAMTLTGKFHLKQRACP
jgi:thioesterase domain-containing protein